MAPTVTDLTAINIPYPVAPEYHLLLKVGACRLHIRPGDGDAWVTGAYHDGSGDGFMKKEGAFWNEAALAGKTPLLTIQANVALGSLKMRST